MQANKTINITEVTLVVAKIEYKGKIDLTSYRITIQMQLGQ